MLSARRAFLPIVALSCWLTPSATQATGCLRDVVVPIHFSPGAVCWRHVGAGTSFTGQFTARQHITAIAIGQFYNSDGKRDWYTTGLWQLSVTGPGAFSANAPDSGQLDTVLPQAGQYKFTVGPCAVWGNEGTIEICTQ